MTVSSIPDFRQLPDFHAEVKEISAQVNFQAEQLRDNKKDLLNKVKEVQEICALTSIRSGYYLRMTPTNVQAFSQLPFIKPDGFTISEKLLDVSGEGVVRSDITKFLREIYANRFRLPKILAELPQNAFPETLPFLPAGVKPRDFFACSTIPAIFGHHWTSELRLAFINFIMEIVDQLPKEAFSSFRDHWLFDVLKNYIHASGVQKFLSISIGDLIFSLICDDELIRLTKNPNTYFFAKITEYAKKMIEQMDKHLSLFPPDVRLLFKRFVANVAPDERITRIEILFLDCVLTPAVSLPKTYGIIPSTYYFDMGQTGPARTLQILAQCFRFILHPNQAAIRYPDANLNNLFQLPLTQLFDKFTLVEEMAITGPKIKDILPLVGAHYIIVIFSIPDIFLLAYLLTKFPNSAATPNLNNFAKKIPTNIKAAFAFFRYEAWDFNAFQIEKPDISENEIEKAPDSLYTNTSDAIYKMLSFIPINPLAPKDTIEFIHFYEKINIVNRNFIAESYVRFLDIKYNNVPEEQQQSILPALEDEIRRRLAFIARNNETLMNISFQFKLLEAEATSYHQKMDDSMPILYAHLLSLFLSKNPKLVNEINSQKKDLLLTKHSFNNFFLVQIKKIESFFKKIAEFAIPGVIGHFHTYLMQILPLKEFQQCHQMYMRCDKILFDLSHQYIETICIKPAPVKVRSLLSSPILFKFAIKSLQRAQFLKIPFETLKEISKAFDLLDQMYMLEFGTFPSNDEMIYMLNYILLSSDITELFSLGKYLEHFLFNLPEFKYEFISKKQKQYLTEFLNQISSLDEIFSNYKEELDDKSNNDDE